jgi:phospholipid/cholesterol/gamma-HCH transport system permease protein
MGSMAVVLGVVAGAAVASLEPDVNLSYFINAALRSTKMADYASGMVKTVFFALNISMVACYMGMNTRGGTVGVGRSTTATVVITSVVTLVSDFFLTKFFIAVGWGAI